MTTNVGQVEAIFANSKRTQMEISKSLACLGFGAWNEVEPGKIITSDALELKFSEPSRAELEIWRAELSRAGQL